MFVSLQARARQRGGASLLLRGRCELASYRGRLDCVKGMIEGFRAGQSINGPDYYRSYLRPVLSTFSDTYAIQLMSKLDRDFGLT
jgi:hypothetical protein